MINLKSKKAAVEMSLNLIIMLIIGIVVLGLVIGFVNNLVNQGKETYTSQLNDNEKLKLEEVARCSENLCMLPDPKIVIKKGESENVFINVRAYSSAIKCNPGDINKCKNIGSGATTFDMSYEVTSDLGNTVISHRCAFDDTTCTTFSGTNSPSVNYRSDYFILSGPGFDISEGDSEAQMYSLRVDPLTPIGTYYLSLGSYLGTTSDPETTKTLTINVE